ncbi:MAG: anaerobic selenocysteine-containing dehydrogenase, partial [Dinoroseobacter sp.]
MPKTVQTMCPMNCHPTLCGMKVQVDGETLLGIEGDPDNPDSQGYLCMRGNAAHEIVENPARLLHPKMRDVAGAGEWRQFGWEDVLDQMAAKMQAVGREAVGLWQSHGNWGNDYAFGLKRAQMERFGNLYGCQHWNPAMICWGLGAFGAGLTGAIEASTKEDMGAHSQMIVLWGVNSVSQANTVRYVEAAKARGARVVVVDVRRTEISALAHEVVLVRP